MKILLGPGRTVLRNTASENRRSHPELSIIIPAHNEERRLAATLVEYARWFPAAEIIVIPNGCTDATILIAEEIALEYSNVAVLGIPTAVGKGAAVVAGVSIASGKYVGYVDADGSTAPDEFGRLLTLIGDDDGVIASRWVRRASVAVPQSLMRRIASRIFNLFVKILFRLPFADTQCGAKVFLAESLRSVIRKVETGNMAFDVDLLYQLMLAGKRVLEVPTRWNDVQGSKVHILRSSLQMLTAMARLRMRHSFARYLIPLFDRLLPTRALRVAERFSILILNWEIPLTLAQVGRKPIFMSWRNAGSRKAYMLNGCPPGFPVAVKRKI